MAHDIVRDSAIGIAQHQVKVPANTKSNTLVRQGAKVGLANHDARQANTTGDWYTTVDTAATIRLENITGAFADGAPVYVTDATPPTVANATAAGSIIAGFAYRAKTAAAGDLFIQLVPTAG